MKRIICMILAIVLMATTIPFAWAEPAQNTATFTVGQVEGKKGDLVTLDITLGEEQTEIGALTIVMQYDTAKLQLVTHPQSTLDTWMIEGEVLTDSSALWFPGDDMFAAIAADGFGVSGVVCSVAFKVLSDIPDGEIASVSILVDTIGHCSDRAFTYDVSVVAGGVIPIDKSAAKAVDAMIDALHVQSLEDESAVLAARKTYDDLDETQKGYVTKLSKLEQAEAKIRELKQIAADKQAAEEVATLIDALDVKSLNDEAAVSAAREAYEALTDSQKGYVTNLVKLEQAEAVIEEIKQSTVLYGDVNGDGSVSASDALQVLKHVVGKLVLTDQEFVAADVSGNGAIEAVDALNILKYVVGKIQQFPVEQ